MPDSEILGSIPAKATQASADLNLEISPNSEMIPAQEIGPIPLIERVGGLSSLIISDLHSSLMPVRFLIQLFHQPCMTDHFMQSPQVLV